MSQPDPSTPAGADPLAHNCPFCHGEGGGEAVMGQCDWKCAHCRGTGRVPFLGQQWVTRVTSEDGDSPSVIGAGGASVHGDASRQLLEAIAHALGYPSEIVDSPDVLIGVVRSLAAAYRDALAAASRRPQPPDGRLRCMDCGMLYADFPLDTHLSRSQWLLIHDSDGGVLCANCIVARIKSRIPGVCVVHVIAEVMPSLAAREPAPSPEQETP